MDILNMSMEEFDELVSAAYETAEVETQEVKDFFDDYVIYDYSRSTLTPSETDNSDFDLIAIDLLTGKKGIFAVDNSRNLVYKVVESDKDPMFPSEVQSSTNVINFEGHKALIPKASISQSNSITGSVVKLKDGSYVTMTSQGLIIKD